MAVARGGWGRVLGGAAAFVTCASIAAMASPRETATSTGTRSRISARIAAVSPSATLAVDAKAKRLKAEGADVIGFGAGEPDFSTPEHIVEAAVAACYEPVNHHYTPTAGIAPLREAVAAKTARDSGYQVAAVAGARDQRRQASGARGVRHDAGPR